MERYRANLARTVDALVAAGRVTITETVTTLSLYQLDGRGAKEVLTGLEHSEFALLRLADEGGDLRPEDVEEDAVAIELVVSKPQVPDGTLPILTKAGFEAALLSPTAEPVIWVQGLDRIVETVGVCYLPWGIECAFSPAPALADPVRVVRCFGELQTTGSIDRWLLRDPETDISGGKLTAWRNGSAKALARALAQEIERDGQLLFRGPPATRFRGENASRIEVPALGAMQRAAGWVYEHARELENRHGLLAAEVARTALRDGDIADLGSVMFGALEGAKIAYGFGLSQQSRDALKSLSDLRKAVSDETAKLADATRSLAAAVMGATVGNVGLVVARLTLNKEARLIAPAAGLIGIALALYVSVVIWSGWHFLTIQRDLRCDWRERLYRFLGDEEYERMVNAPVERAEAGFKTSAIIGGAIAGLMLLAVMFIINKSI